MLLSGNHTLSEELHRLQALMVAHHVEGKLSLHEETECGGVGERSGVKTPTSWLVGKTQYEVPLLLYC